MSLIYRPLKSDFERYGRVVGATLAPGGGHFLVQIVTWDGVSMRVPVFMESATKFRAGKPHNASSPKSRAASVTFPEEIHHVMQYAALRAYLSDARTLGWKFRSTINAEGNVAFEKA